MPTMKAMKATKAMKAMKGPAMKAMKVKAMKAMTMKAIQKKPARGRPTFVSSGRSFRINAISLFGLFWSFLLSDPGENGSGLRRPGLEQREFPDPAAPRGPGDGSDQREYTLLRP